MSPRIVPTAKPGVVPSRHLSHKESAGRTGRVALTNAYRQTLQHADILRLQRSVGNRRTAQILRNSSAPVASGGRTLLQRLGVSIRTSGSGGARSISEVSIDRLDKESLLGSDKGTHTTAYGSIMDGLRRVLAPGTPLSEASEGLIAMAKEILALPGNQLASNLEEIELQRYNNAKTKVQTGISDLEDTDDEYRHEHVLNLANDLLVFRNMIPLTNFKMGIASTKGEQMPMALLWWRETGERRNHLAGHYKNPPDNLLANQCMWDLFDPEPLDSLFDKDYVKAPGVEGSSDSAESLAAQMLFQHVESMYISYPKTALAIDFSAYENIASYLADQDYIRSQITAIMEQYMTLL